MRPGVPKGASFNSEGRYLMNIAENTHRAETNPIAEILEPIRRRVLRERAAQDERDGCLVIDYLDDLRKEPGA